MFSRHRTSSAEVVDLDRIIGDTVLLLRSTIDRIIDVSLEFSAEWSFVCGDSSLLQSALLNLGINASQLLRWERIPILVYVPVAQKAQKTAIALAQEYCGGFIERTMRMFCWRRCVQCWR